MAAKARGLSRGFPKVENKALPEALLGVGEIDHPPHYQGKIECIDALESCLDGLEGFEAFCSGNAMKYLWRWKNKGDATGDLDKAAWYIGRLKTHISERTK